MCTAQCKGLTGLPAAQMSQQKQAAAPAAPKVAQGFRKARVDDEERLAREAERDAQYEANRKKKSTASTFASLYGTKVCALLHEHKVAMPALGLPGLAHERGTTGGDQ